MKNGFFRFTLSAFLFLSLTSAEAIVVGDAFPELEIAGYSKGAINPSELSGRVTIINFWATWCEACKVELKEMEQVFSSLHEEKDFSFSFVSLDKEPAKAEAWVKDNMRKADQYMAYLFKDPSFAAADQLSVDSFPMTFIVGRDGKIKFIQRGFKAGEGSTEKLAEEVKKLLKM